MPETPLSAAVLDALRQLFYSDGERAGIVSALAHARDLAAHDHGLERVQAVVTAAGQQEQAAASRRRQLEADLEDARLRIQRAESRLASGRLQAQREIEAVQHEIASLQGMMTEYETEWLQVSDKEETAQSALVQAQAALDAETPAARARHARAEEDVRGAEQRLADIDVLRRQAAQKLPAEVRDRYRALYSKTGGRPFAEAMAGECSHCRQGIPAAAMQTLRSRSGVPACPSCGRLLLNP